jgi:uncharacterized protein YrrD
MQGALAGKLIMEVIHGAVVSVATGSKAGSVQEVLISLYLELVLDMVQKRYLVLHCCIKV